jgi:hypothetical protein
VAEESEYGEDSTVRIRRRVDADLEEDLGDVRFDCAVGDIETIGDRDEVPNIRRSCRFRVLYDSASHREMDVCGSSRIARLRDKEG